MTTPKFYHSDRLRLGALSGQYAGTTNPVLRIADGSITVAYAATSGATPTGVFETRITSGLGDPQQPSHFVIARATPTLSGYRLLVESEDLDGSNNAQHLDETVTTAATHGVWTLSGSLAERRVWRVTLSGTGGLAPLKLYEAMLADEYEAPRPQVGVRRTRVRQFTRIPLPGTQAFVKRDGPQLRSHGYSLVLISGAEIDAFHTLVSGIEGGEPIYHVDDLGLGWFAEVVGEEIQELDEAGVYSVDLQVLEIQVD